MRGEINLGLIWFMILFIIAMFVFPMMVVSQQNAQVVQMFLQEKSNEYTYNVSTEKKITLEEYEKFLLTVSSADVSCDVEIRVDVLDENVGKKTIQVTASKIGENETFPIYTSQLESEMKINGTYELNQGDRVTVKITIEQTMFDVIMGAFFKFAGNDTYSAEIESSVMI